MTDAVIGKLLEKQAEDAFRSSVIIADTMSSFGVILLLDDWFGEKIKNLDRIKKSDALIIGFAQALAVIPGVSRSGSTIATGLFLGFKREDAARFSFLMLMPITFGAGLVGLKEGFGGASLVNLLAGFSAAPITGFLSVQSLLRYIINHQ